MNELLVGMGQRFQQPLQGNPTTFLSHDLQRNNDTSVNMRTAASHTEPHGYDPLVKGFGADLTGQVTKENQSALT